MKTKNWIAILLLGAGGLLAASSLPCRAADRMPDTTVVYPAGALVQNGGRVINLKSPPAGITPAVGNGTVDDTASFQDAYDYIKNAFVANETAPYAAYIIYVPNGTYRVTSTIIYRGTTNEFMANVCFVGQNRNNTIIKLDNNLAAFQSVTAPIPVLAYQYPIPLGTAKGTDPKNVGTNNPANNLCENLTVNTGSGNPGAAGIFFQGANGAHMSNVTVTSGDGQGYCGVWLEVASIQAYLKDVTINGFNYGISCIANGENDSAWEHISINNPTVAGIYQWGGGMTVRDLDLNQATLHVPAAQINNNGDSLVLLDSHLNGGSSASPAITMNDTGSPTKPRMDLVLRNVAFSGYTVDVSDQGTTVATGAFVSEYVSNQIATLFPEPDLHTFAMPVQDTPTVAWESNLNNWVSVNNYDGTGNGPSGHGAKGDGVTDDTTAIQNAFAYAAANNKTVVYFPSQKYVLTGTVTIPVQVQRVEFMFSNLTGGSFAVSAASSNPLVLAGKVGYAAINITAARNIIALVCSGLINNLQSAPLSVFLETSNNNGAGPTFCTANESVWARSADDETPSGTDLANNGGRLWIMGFKTENKPSIPIDAEGGYTEVLGGYINTTQNGAPPEMLENKNANLCFTGFTNFNGETKIPIAVSETRNGSTPPGLASNNTALFPARGGGYSNDILIPLYLGGVRPSGPFGVFTANQDVGSVATPGTSNNYNAQTYIIDGSGSDIGGAADSFQYLDTAWSGFGSLTALVESVDNTDPGAKAALTFRAGTAAGDINVAVTVAATSGVTLQARTTTGGATTTSGSLPVQPPCWVRLSRMTNTTFAAFTSTDGVTWSQFGSVVTANLPASVTAGLGVTAHNNNGTVARSILSNVALQDLVGQDIGAVGLAGSTVLNGSAHDVTGAGAGIAGSADAFQYAYLPVTGDCTISARVAYFQNSTASTLAGVMIRETLTPGSTFVAALSAPNTTTGKVFAARTMTGGTASVANTPGSDQGWYRVKRVGNVFTASISTDGTTWNAFGSPQTIPMASLVYVGLPVTSGSTSALAFAAFDHLFITSP